MPADRNTRSITRNLLSSSASQDPPTSSTTTEGITKHFKHLRIKSEKVLDDICGHLTKIIDNPPAGQPSEIDQPKPEQEDQSTAAVVFRPSKRGLRRSPYDTDTPALPPLAARRKLIQAKRILAQQVQREKPYEPIPAPCWLATVSTLSEREGIAAAFSTQLDMSPATVAAIHLPSAPAAEEPEYGYLDGDSLKSTLDEILSNATDVSSPAPSLAGSDWTSSGSSLPSPVSSVSSLPSIVFEEPYENCSYGKVETTKSIKKHRSSGPYSRVDRKLKQKNSSERITGPQAVPASILRRFNRIYGTRYSQGECKELLKYRSPDSLKLFRSCKSHEEFDQAMAEHRVTWERKLGLQLLLEGWEEHSDASGYDGEDEYGEYDDGY